MLRTLSIFLLFVFSVNSHCVGIGDQAPKISLPQLEGGKKLSIKNFRGKVVYVDFWASWCGPCRQSLPLMNEIRNKLNNKGFEVFAINLDEDPEAAKAFLKQYPVQYPVVSDKEGKTPEIYSIPGMPTSYLIDRSGTIRDIHLGFKESDIVKIEKEIKTLLKERM